MNFQAFWKNPVFASKASFLTVRRVAGEFYFLAERRRIRK